MASVQQHPGRLISGSVELRHCHRLRRQTMGCSGSIQQKTAPCFRSIPVRDRIQHAFLSQTPFSQQHFPPRRFVLGIVRMYVVPAISQDSRIIRYCTYTWRVPVPSYRAPTGFLYTSSASTFRIVPERVPPTCDPKVAEVPDIWVSCLCD